MISLVTSHHRQPRHRLGVELTRVGSSTQPGYCCRYILVFRQHKLIKQTGTEHRDRWTERTPALGST